MTSRWESLTQILIFQGGGVRAEPRKYLNSRCSQDGMYSSGPRPSDKGGRGGGRGRACLQKTKKRHSDVKRCLAKRWNEKWSDITKADSKTKNK